MREESVAREALFYSIQLPINATMKLKHNRVLQVSLQHDGFYLPHAIGDQRGVLSNASVLFFRWNMNPINNNEVIMYVLTLFPSFPSDDGSGYFSDAKEFAYEITSTAKLMVRKLFLLRALPLYNSHRCSSSSSSSSCCCRFCCLGSCYYHLQQLAV